MTEFGNIEWRNGNSQRRYPFADDCSLTSTFGLPMADDVFIDGMFYPISPGSRLYLKSLQLSQNTAQICDSSGYVAEADITAAETLIFRDERGRVAGMLLKGPGFSSLPIDMTFAIDATPFAPGVVAPQKDTIVRGIILPDGTLVTGSVRFQGENGVEVSTYMQGTTPILRIDAIGSSTPPSECVDNCEYALKCVQLHYLGGTGALWATQTDNVINLYGPALADIRKMTAILNGARPLPVDPDTSPCPDDAAGVTPYPVSSVPKKLPEDQCRPVPTTEVLIKTLCPGGVLPAPKPPVIGTCPPDGTYNDYYIVADSDSVNVSKGTEDNEVTISMKGLVC